MQLGFVVAAGAVQQSGFFFTPAIGRDQQHADADLARIG
jgi:hypothetical protein